MNRAAQIKSKLPKTGTLIQGTIFAIIGLMLLATTSAAPQTLPAPKNLGTDISKYLTLPGDQIVVIPNGTYSAGTDPVKKDLSVKAPHPATNGQYGGWLILVAEDPYQVVVDLYNTGLTLESPSARILFVGMSFINGTLTMNSIDNINFWYTNHEYKGCIYHQKLVNAATSRGYVKGVDYPNTNPRRDPCGDGGGYLLTW